MKNELIFYLDNTQSSNNYKEEYEEVIKDGGYKRNEIEVNWHGHQDRGLGVANNIAAAAAGADVIHGTALGVGERSVNAPLDEFPELLDGA